MTHYTSPHLTREETIALADQSLPPEDKARALLHVQTCPACQKALAAEEAFQHQLAQAMNNHLDQVQAPKSMRFAPIKHRMESGRRPRRAWILMAGAAALFLVASVSFWTMQDPQSHIASKPGMGTTPAKPTDIAMHKGPPEGWTLTGESLEGYEVGTIDGIARRGHSSSYLKGRADMAPPQGFVSLMQYIDATPYKGQKIRFSAWMKLQGVQQRTGLWMRVSQGQQVLSFDNMDSRPLSGDSNWSQQEVVLAVPASADIISFGMLLTGAGMVYVDELSLEQAPADSPVTGGLGSPKGPRNLDFEQPASPE